MDPSFDGHSHHSYQLSTRSLLLFVGNTLGWLMGTATTKDINSIKKRVNQLIEAQSMHNRKLWFTSYPFLACHVMCSRGKQACSINVLMDKVDEAVHDVNNLYNLTTSLATSLSYHQLILHLRSVLANLHGIHYLILEPVSSAYHGLCQCSYNWNTFASCLTYYRP